MNRLQKRLNIALAKQLDLFDRQVKQEVGDHICQKVQRCCLLVVLLLKHMERFIEHLDQLSVFRGTADQAVGFHTLDDLCFHLLLNRHALGFGGSSQDDVVEAAQALGVFEGGGFQDLIQNLSVGLL